jgi:hypothetical protein
MKVRKQMLRIVVVVALILLRNVPLCGQSTPSDPEMIVVAGNMLNYFEKGLSFSSNPGSNAISINPSDLYNISVYNMDGKMIHDQQAVSDIATNGMKHGIYVLKIKTNSTTVIKKFIK